MITMVTVKGEMARDITECQQHLIADYKVVVKASRYENIFPGQLYYYFSLYKSSYDGNLHYHTSQT